MMEEIKTPNTQNPKEAKRRHRFRFRRDDEGLFLNLNPDIVIKNLAMFITFALLNSLLINYYLWPVVLKLKNTITLKQQTEYVLEAIDKRIANAKQKVTTTQTQNAEMFSMLNTKRDNDFLSKYSSFFLKLTITKDIFVNDEAKQITTTRYKLSGIAKGIEDILKFMDALDRSSLTFYVAMPITISKNLTNNKLLDFEIYIDLIDSTYIAPDLDSGY